LVKVVDASTNYTVAEYQYDGRNFRVLKDVYTSGAVSQTRHYYYNSTWQDLEQRVGTSIAAERQFVWGQRFVDDLILRDHDGTGDGTLDERLYAVQDPNWNVTAIAGAGGDVAGRFAYDAYGSCLFFDGSFVRETLPGYGWEHLFAARDADATTGLYAYRTRIFLPRVCRFITRDPAGYNAGTNLYEYVDGSPTGRVDPSGQMTYKVVVCTVCEDKGNNVCDYDCECPRGFMSQFGPSHRLSCKPCDEEQTLMCFRRSGWDKIVLGAAAAGALLWNAVQVTAETAVDALDYASGAAGIFVLPGAYLYDDGPA
jgi:RHS repeat-associated protein